MFQSANLLVKSVTLTHINFASYPLMTKEKKGIHTTDEEDIVHQRFTDITTADRILRQVGIYILSLSGVSTAILCPNSIIIKFSRSSCRSGGGGGGDHFHFNTLGLRGRA